MLLNTKVTYLRLNNLYLIMIFNMTPFQNNNKVKVYILNFNIILYTLHIVHTVYFINKNNDILYIL